MSDAKTRAQNDVDAQATWTYLYNVTREVGYKEVTLRGTTRQYLDALNMAMVNGLRAQHTIRPEREWVDVDIETDNGNDWDAPFETITLRMYHIHKD